VRSTVRSSSVFAGFTRLGAMDAQVHPAATRVAASTMIGKGCDASATTDLQGGSVTAVHAEAAGPITEIVLDDATRIDLPGATTTVTVPLRGRSYDQVKGRGVIRAAVQNPLGTTRAYVGISVFARHADRARLRRLREPRARERGRGDPEA
jgi:hypothetical protein